ncbi:Oidioi.mRNA.OKI2018_I69.chr1.g192.t1.cds [Oikopleura dioica]|uniref:Oidioi.mRNA.OKI2018_I69.chr1.g192.t1.cds n=1 Tax=Oikopleura dioica TaxID=34765 RepID=A0ABN7SPA4_OIKDI|nr:Oidioi.mRNA.OKI2018_I69.chr1.g192.t1.cds [Oikopleura dioica]
MEENGLKKNHFNLRIKHRASQRFSTASNTLTKFAEKGSKRKNDICKEEAARIIQRQWRVFSQKKKFLKEINEEFFNEEKLRVEKMELQLETMKFEMEMEAYLAELEDLDFFFKNAEKRRKAAAFKIQHAWRAYLRRKNTS